MSLTATVDYFCPDKHKGEGESPPCSCPKSGTPTSPVILTDTANLDRFGALPVYTKTKTCTPKYLVMQCSCGRHIIPSTCMSLNCTGCKDFVAKRRSDSIFRRLLAHSVVDRNQYNRFNRQDVIYTIFTVPIMERFRFVNKDEWQKVRRKAWKILKAEFGAKFGVEATHPVGDSDTSLFHPHLNFLWVQKKGWRSFIDVEKLRNEWARVLGVKIADVYSQYSSKVRKIKHWCNYVSRTFPGTHAWTGPVRWYGKYPIIKNDVLTTCADCGDKFKMIGWISKQTVDNYYKHGFMMGIDPPWKRDNEINFY